MINNATFNSKSPLPIEDIQLIEATKLPPLDKHYLRLLAHCLACFKEISQESNAGPLPPQAELEQWCLNQPAVSNDTSFAELLIEQFQVTRIHFERLAIENGITPLELTLKDLIESCLAPKKDGIGPLE